MTSAKFIKASNLPLSVKGLREILKDINSKTPVMRFGAMLNMAKHLEDISLLVVHRPKDTASVFNEIASDDLYSSCVKHLCDVFSTKMCIPEFHDCDLVMRLVTTLLPRIQKVDAANSDVKTNIHVNLSQLYRSICPRCISSLHRLEIPIPSKDTVYTTLSWMGDYFDAIPSLRSAICSFLSRRVVFVHAMLAFSSYDFLTLLTSSLGHILLIVRPSPVDVRKGVVDHRIMDMVNTLHSKPPNLVRAGERLGPLSALQNRLAEDNYRHWIGVLQKSCVEEAVTYFNRVYRLLDEGGVDNLHTMGSILRDYVCGFEYE